MLNSPLANTDGVDFSFIVPAFNEEAVISICLGSLRRVISQETTAEIIVVDNGSTDKTRAIAERLESVTVYHCPGVKVGAVRNMGAKKARGRYLIFIDADCLVDAAFLSRAAELVKAKPDSVWGGGATNPENATWVERHWLLEKNGRTPLPRHLIGASMLMPKRVFDKVGGFDESLESGEDTDLHRRLELAGVEVFITDEINVAHLGNATTLKAFFQRQGWHGRSYHPNPLKNLHDPVYVLIILAGLCALAGLFLLPAPPRSGALFLVLAAIIPAVLTAKRFWRAQRWPGSVHEAIRCYALDVVYVAGRLRGIIASTIEPRSRARGKTGPR